MLNSPWPLAVGLVAAVAGLLLTDSYPDIDQRELAGASKGDPDWVVRASRPYLAAVSRVTGVRYVTLLVVSWTCLLYTSRCV